MNTISARSLLISTTVCSILAGPSVNPALSQHAAAAISGSRGSGPGETNASPASTARKDSGPNSSGALVAMIAAPDGTRKLLGDCPLKHTNVNATISGYVARVSVTQIFENTFTDKIEAVYTFPLSDSGAVDAMTMKIGSRVIKGSIKKREEARDIYNQARARGHVASLLDQERTNIFTQSVANIEPGAKVEITINYSELLPYEAGRYSFAFPTVVGPRFNPGRPAGHSGTGRAFDTDMVPDASKITPPVAKDGERAGHDISIAVAIRGGGLAISNLSSKLHEVDVKSDGASDATVTLKTKSTIPNKDFVLTWDVAADDIKSGYLTHRADKEKPGYFTLMVMPPKRVTPDKAAPKEMIFLIDCSGSQYGPPLEKAKETMRYILDHMNANDTFQILAFNNTVQTLFQKPQVAGAQMKEEAKLFIDRLSAQGGTWMAPAVEAACKIPADANRLRIVTFMTDGYVGNDMEILGLVKKLRGTSRWFPFGTGSSVNRLLINGMANEGGGEPEFVLLNSSGSEVGKRFYSRIASPVLTDVKVDFDGLKVKEVFPHNVSDVWAERPLYIKGRYLRPGAGTVTISGFAGGKPYTQKLAVDFPEENKANAVIAPIWARAKVDRLMSEDWFGAQSGSPNQELRDEIVQTALDHHIMTQYTSFVAVDESEVTKGGASRTVPVKVEVPAGVSRKHALGELNKTKFYSAPRRLQIINERPVAGRILSNLPPTSMDSFVYEGGDASHIYGDEAASQTPPYFGFKTAHNIETGIHGLRRSGSTTHGTHGYMPEAWGGDEWVDGPEFTSSGAGYSAPVFSSGSGFAAASPAPVASAPGASAGESSARPERNARTSKLDAELVELSDGKKAPLSRTLTIENGRVLVKVVLSGLDRATLSLLKACGLKITKQDASENAVTGWIRPSNLKVLARQKSVKLVLPVSHRAGTQH